MSVCEQTPPRSRTGTASGRSIRADAVIFDMDGLLLDSESLALRALTAVAGRMGIDAPPDFCHQMIGIPVDRCLLLVRKRFGPEFPCENYLAAAADYAEDLIRSGLLSLKPGALELLSQLDELGIPKAIATSSSRAKAETHLRAAGILDRFDAIATRDDVKHGKPSPDLFLKAASLVGADPSRCLALEDSYNGIRAAQAAGMRVIMVPDLLPATEEMRKTCLLIAPDLHAVGKLLTPRRR